MSTFSLPVSESIGSVTATYLIPDNVFCILTFAHGAGAGMNHSFMVALAEALASENIGTLRFNFPFAEKRSGRPDLPAVAHKTIESALKHVLDSNPAVPVFLSGKSFGGRMSSQFVSNNPDAEVKGLIFYGFPLHPPKKPSIDRAEHLNKITKPMLFLQGTKDALAEWKLIEQVCGSLPNSSLVKFEGADHGFKKGKLNLVPEIAKETRTWIDRNL